MNSLPNISGDNEDIVFHQFGRYPAKAETRDERIILMMIKIQRLLYQILPNIDFGLEYI